jgi:hypothetical protein
MPAIPGFIYTIEVDSKPTVAFEARQLREANELCQEEWLRSDLASLSSGGSPLYSCASKLRARIANDTERAMYHEMAKGAEVSGELILAYLVDIDVG